MQIRSRKFIGTLLLLAYVFVYALVAMVLGSVIVPRTPVWVHVIFFVIAGLVWILPAMLMIRWMQRQDPSAPS
ncbi:MAG: DUF2842 domain-containing protein [Hyphomicrobiales bacterium]